MTIPHVPSNAQRIAYASEQNALIDQCNETTTQTDQQQATIDGHTSTLSTHGSRLGALETAPPAHTHPIADVTSLQTTLDGKSSTSHTHALPLDALTDVDTSTVAPASGQVLKWNGTTWAPANDLTADAGTGGATTLDGLDDVTVTAPAENHVIVYNGTTWVNTLIPPDAAAYRGQWTDAGGDVAGTQILNASGGGGVGVKVADIGVALETAVGCSMSAGTFTANVGGRWRFSVSTQYQGGNTAIRALYLALGSAASSPSGAKFGLTGAPSEDAQSTGHEITLAAGGTVSVYVAVWTSGGQVTVHRAQGNVLTATWLGP